MRRAYKFRLYPNANQTRELEIALESHRRLYNEALGYRQFAWEVYRTRIAYFDQTCWLKAVRKVNPFYARLNVNSAKVTLRRLDLAYLAFFKRGGYPRFQGRNRLDSFAFAFANGAQLVGNKLRLQFIGTIRIKMHRDIQGKIKTVTLKRECGKWYAIFSCDLGEQHIPASSAPPVGIDVGIESFLTTSNGDKVASPSYLKTALPELRRVQRSVSRKTRGGANRRKTVFKLQKAHARIRNLRREHHHQIALKLVRLYGTVAVESLNVQGMLRNRRLARAIQDAGWYTFLLILRCKAESAGVQVIDVNARGTSQECSQCGAVVQKDLTQRWHDCSCGLSIHRDVNAARNILARAAVRTEPTGLNVSNSLHVQRNRQLSLLV